jgi:hypothetical protein
MGEEARDERRDSRPASRVQGLHMRPPATTVAAALALALAAPASGCSAFVLLARETRGRGLDGDLVVGQAVEGDTSGGTSAVVPGCGSGADAPERRYTFTAPETRRYVVRTESSFDAVLAVYPHDGPQDDTGSPLQCNDDDGSIARSRIVLEAQAGTTYDVVVDGYGNNRGAFRLLVEPDDASLGQVGPPRDPVPGPGPTPSGAPLQVGAAVRGSTRGGVDTRTLSCGAPTVGTPDVTYVFTPPERGVYVFRTQTDYDGTLEVFDGVRSLGCNDDDGSTRASRVTATLDAGRTYAVVLDGFGSAQGDFQLVVEHPIAQQGGTLTLGATVRGTTLGSPDTVTLPCGAPRAGSPDVSYAFTPSEDGLYVFRTQTDYDGTLAVYDAGAPLGCNDDDGTTRASRVSVTLTAGRTYQVVLDGYAGGSGSYELSVTHPIVQPAGPITAGQTVSGSTAGAADVRTPPCGSQPGSPDQIWTFAPPVTGTYRLHVDSDYDGVLAVYPVGAPDPLMCNDDAGSTRASEIEGSLLAGQRYEIVVDGYAGGSGHYTLRLDLLSGVGGAPVAAPSSIRPSIQGGPLPEDLGEMERRCVAAPRLGTGHHSGVIEPTEGAAQVGCGSGGPGGDQVFVVSLPEPSTVDVHVAADFAVAIEVRSTCTGAASRCVVATPPMGADLTLSLPAGEHVLVVDALESGARGPVHLDLHVRPAAPVQAP